MTKPRSDAFVLFGATGDLAHKKTFGVALRDGPSWPSERAGHRRGVEDWSVDQLCERARDGIQLSEGAVDEKVFSRSSPSCSAMWAATIAIRRPSSACAMRWTAASARSTTSRSRPACSSRWCRASSNPAPPRRTSHGREAIRSRSRLGALAQPHAASGVSTRSRSSGSITISARKRCRTCCISASPMPFSSRSGTAISSRACKSRWPRTSASKAAASSTRKWARFATWCRTTCSTSSRSWRWNRRRQARAIGARPEGRGAAGDPAARRGQQSCAASSKATSMNPVWRRIERRDFRRGAAPYRFVALERSAVLHPRRQGLPVRAPKSWFACARRRSTCSLRSWRAGNNYVRFRLGPDVAIAFGASSKLPGERMPATMSSCSPANRSGKKCRLRTTDRRCHGRRRDTVHARRFSRCGLADRPAAPQKRKASTTLRAGHVGAGRSPAWLRAAPWLDRRQPLEGQSGGAPGRRRSLHPRENQQIWLFATGRPSGA